ncbi:MAG: Tetratricopeptide (TPR) repeat [Verrucomicrobia bacterium]|nr:MAG: Tetratricopeptide (TPR) repeat [Verrucomicrobiota bacterium]
MESSSKQKKGHSSSGFSPTAPTAPTSFLQTLDGIKIPLLAAGLFLLVLAVFGEARNFTFLSYDDNQYILEIPAVREGLSLSSIWWAVSHSHVGQWHPLTSWSFIFDSSVSGLPAQLAGKKGPDAAGWFHLHNILLHGAAAALLFLALRKLTGSVWRSAFAAAIFAVHPLRAESVAWVTERKDVLSGLFLMATLWAYGFYAEKSASRKRHLLLCVLFALGLLAKPMLVTLPFVFLLLDIWPLNRLDIEPAVSGDWQPTWKQALPLIREKLPLFIMAFASAVGAVFAVGTPFRPIPILPLLPRLEYIPVSYVNYFKQLFIPVNLSPHYPFVVEGPALWKVGGSIAVLLVLSWLAWSWRKKQPSFLLGWLWFLGTLLPVIGLVPGGIQISADRYTYLPQIGLGISIAWIFGSLVSTQLQKQTAAVAGVAIVALLSVAAAQQTAIWKDDESLWTHALKVTKDNDYADEKLASAFQARALRESPEKAQELRKEAERLFRDAIRLNPHLVGSLNNLSVLLRSKGELREAIELQAKAAAEHPSWGLMHRNLASVLTQNRNYEEAAVSFEKAIALDANDIESHYNLGLILSETKTDPESLQKAMVHFEAAVRLQPRFAEAHFSIGNALYRQGKVDEAIASFRRAIESDPRHARACNNLASLLGTKGEKDEPMRLYTQAVNIDPNYIEAYRNLAEALLKAGNGASAVQVWKTALERSPNDLPILYRLSWIMATHPDPAVRRTFEPVDLAKRGVELTQSKEPAFLDALAAAYAQTSRFTEACQLVSQAIEILPQGKASPQADALRARLSLYKEEKPYRESAPGAGQ